jgi:mannosyltransferase
VIDQPFGSNRPGINSVRLFKSKSAVLLLAITLVGALLRLCGLTIHSLWLDELQSVITAAPINSFAKVNEICVSSFDPAPRTFYYLLTIWFRIFGYNDLSARLLSALFGIVTIPVMYLLGKRLFGERAGMYAALIIAVNYFNIYYSLEVRFYSALVLFSAVSFLAFDKLVEREDGRSALWYALSTLVLVALHYFALLLLLTQVLIWIVIKRGELLKVRRVLPALAAFLFVVLGFLPFVPSLLTTLSWEGSGQSFDGDRFFMVFYFSLFFGTNGIVVFTALACVTLFAVKAFLDISSESAQISSSRAFMLFAWLIFPVLLAYTRTLYGSSALAPRYAIVVLPSLLLMVAAGAASVKSRLLRGGLIFAFVAGSFIKLFPDNRFYSFNSKEDFRGVVEKIEQATSIESNAVVFSNRNWHLNYYFRQTSLSPRLIDVDGITDGRFFTGAQMPAEQLIKDTSIVDMWVASAHRSALDRMREVSRSIRVSGSFNIIDSFSGVDAFAHHYIRDTWEQGKILYNKLNGISLLPNILHLPADKFVDDSGKKVAPLWSGDLSSKPVTLTKGDHTVILDCRGTKARDMFPVVDVLIDGRMVGRFTTGPAYEERSFAFSLPDEREIKLKLVMRGDFFDPGTGEDRNVYFRRVVIK